MINIISKSLTSANTSGPKKVAESLVKGLSRIGYPFVVNARLDACPRVWIHDDLDALREVLRIESSLPVVGPNLYIMPRHVPQDLDLSKTLYVHPSQWVVDLWKERGWDRSPLAAWPAGIDTDEFKPSAEPKEHVLVYFKQRHEKELSSAEDALMAAGLPYKVLRYGSYKESEYKSLLAKARWVLWIGRQESQGIALEEALASGVPVLVWDVKSLGHWQASHKEMAAFTPEENAFAGATAAYYFDDRCGIRFKDDALLDQSIAEMESRLSHFDPRAYVLESLSLEKQARDFVALWEKRWGTTFKQGLSERVLRRGKWKNARMPHRLYQTAKDLAKRLQRTCAGLSKGQ